MKKHIVNFRYFYRFHTEIINIKWLLVNNFGGFFFDDYFVAQFFSQVLRKCSYGIKEVASLSALRFFASLCTPCGAGLRSE